MINALLVVPLVGVGLIIWGLIRHQRTALWIGVGLLVLWAVLGLVDWWVGC